MIMSNQQVLRYQVRVHDEDGSLWAEVLDLPGCFASGDTEDELREALDEAISLYLSDRDHAVRGRSLPSESVTELREQSWELVIA